METKGLIFPPYYVNTEKKFVVANIEYEKIFIFQNAFLEMFPDFVIYVVWSKRLMDEIVFSIEHNLDPFIANNTMADMAIAYVHKYGNPIRTHFPIEIDGEPFLQLSFKNDEATVYLPFSYDLYNAFFKEFYSSFNDKGYVIFGPESNKVNAQRHKFLDENDLWPKY